MYIEPSTATAGILVYERATINATQVLECCRREKLEQVLFLLRQPRQGFEERRGNILHRSLSKAPFRRTEMAQSILNVIRCGCIRFDKLRLRG